MSVVDFFLPELHLLHPVANDVHASTPSATFNATSNSSFNPSTLGTDALSGGYDKAQYIGLDYVDDIYNPILPVIGVVVLSLAHIILHFLLCSATSPDKLAPSSDELEKDGSSKTTEVGSRTMRRDSKGVLRDEWGRDLFGRFPNTLPFEFVAGFSCLLLALIGITSWTFDPPLEDKLYGTTPLSHLLCVTMLSYQIYDFAVCVIVKSLRSKEMLMHHLLSAALAYSALHPFLQGYAAFFFGMTEVSNVFLSGMDFFDICPKLKSSFPRVQFVVMALFAFTFLLFRGVLWPFVSFAASRQLVQLLADDTAHSNGAVYLALVANIPLTLLQVMWARSILTAVASVVGGADGKDVKSH